MERRALFVNAIGSRLRSISVRPTLRSFHRDIGNLAVGLTIVYAISGLAVNHIADWDPNFKSYEKTLNLGPLSGDDNAISSAVLTKLSISEKPNEVYRAAEDRLDIVFKNRTLHVTPASGLIVDEGQKPRFLLRVANWLHLNRGKKSWSYIADAYAVFLLFLAFSGVLMTPGKKGIWGRGGVFLAIGILIPIVYLQFSSP